MQSLKKFALFVLAAVFSAALAIGPAQAQDARISVNIPFDFVLGKATLKAGTYRVETQGTFLSIAGAEGRTSYTLLLAGGNVASRNGEPYLVFTRYGTESFLSRVVFSAHDNYDLPRSSKEKEIMAHLPSGEQVAVLIEPAR